MTADYVNISGFTVTGATGRGTGIIIGAGSDHCNVSGNNVSGNTHGITMVYENNYTTIENNIVRSNTERGIYFQCQQNTHSTITGNEITYNGDGIYMLWSAGNNITCNLVQNNNANGIYLTGSTANNITCNLIQNNHASGIYLTGTSTGNVIENNNIIENGVYNRVTRGWEWNLWNVQSCNVTVQHNHWGSTDPEVITASIREDSGGVVDYSSFENETCTCTPAPESYTISEANAPVLHVGDGMNYTTIQDAVTTASSGTVIVVHAGNYTENVEIFRPSITLIGEGMDLVTVEAADATGNVFYVTADYVNISGFTVTGATGGSWGTGIRIGRMSDHCNISCNNVSGNKYGIIMESTNHYTTIKNNIVRSNTGRGISLQYQSTHNTIAGNEITYNGDGIYLDRSTGNNITCNLVQNNSASGIHLYRGSTGNVIEHNNIIENGVYNRVTRGWEWNLWNGQSYNVTVQHNHWGTTDPEVIAASVREDSGSVVDYSSFENGICICTPTPESYNISKANAPVLHVGDGMNYTTIQDAVTTASSGTVIVVHAGTYTENVEIFRPSITLLGEGMDLVTVEAADATGKVFYVTADYVNISGFTVTGATGWSGGTGIVIGYGSDHCNISCNNVSGNRHGIIMGYASNYTIIENNIVRSNTEHGIYLQCHQNTHSTIAGNEITYNGDGIYMYWSAGNNITCNLIQNNHASGIYLTGGSTGNVIEHNNIIENGVYDTVTRGWEWNLHNAQPNTVTVKHNHWGTTDPEVIAASVREESGGAVDYSSFENETCTCTPTPEPYTISEASS
jgi:parallel beta-helix repeat protein